MIKIASAAILVGGKSKRMGYNKALLCLGQENLIGSISKKLKTIFSEVFLVGADSRSFSYLSLPAVADIYKGCGPLAGIHAALLGASRSYVFVMACDMPFVDLNLILFLIRKAKGYDVTVPESRGYLEPLYAVYGKSCLPVIETHLESGKSKVSSFFSQVRTKYVREEELCGFDLGRVFLNINTPKDIERAKKYIKL